MNKNISPKKDIFKYLFSDIYRDYNEYENIAGYEIDKNPPIESIYDKGKIMVKNKCFSILYRPDSYENNIPKTFTLQGVNIFHKTDEVILGEYIGENIEIINKIYKNKIKDTFVFKISKRYYYDPPGKIKKGSIYLAISVIDNIIVNIYYGYILWNPDVDY